MDFKFDLFGEGPKDPTKQGQIKEWVRGFFKLAAETPVLVTEIYCDQPGCAPIETHVGLLRPNGREQYRIMRPMKEVIKQDIPHMIPNPDGHGARIDLDKLGDGSKWK